MIDSSAEKLADEMDADVIIAPVSLAEDFRRIILKPVAFNLVYRIRERMPLTGVIDWMEVDHGSGPWFERHALEKGGPSGFETWRAMTIRLHFKLAELEVVRLLSLEG